MTDISPIPVLNSILHTLPEQGREISTSPWNGRGREVVTPSRLEIEAAPVGSLLVHGVKLAAYCVPVPEAAIQDGHVFTPKGLAPITAGPFAVFASNNAGTTLYDQGISSCANFS